MNYVWHFSPSIIERRVAEGPDGMPVAADCATSIEAKSAINSVTFAISAKFNNNFGVNSEKFFTFAAQKRCSAIIHGDSCTYKRGKEAEANSALLQTKPRQIIVLQGITPLRKLQDIAQTEGHPSTPPSKRSNAEH